MSNGSMLPKAPGADQQFIPNVILQYRNNETSRGKVDNLSAAWSEAELLVFGKLRQGCHPQVLEHKIRQYLLVPPESHQGSYARLYLLSAIRILSNLIKNEMFVRDEDEEQVLRFRFVEELGFDKEALKEMGKSVPLDDWSCEWLGKLSEHKFQASEKHYEANEEYILSHSPVLGSVLFIGSATTGQCHQLSQQAIPSDMDNAPRDTRPATSLPSFDDSDDEKSPRFLITIAPRRMVYEPATTQSNANQNPSTPPRATNTLLIQPPVAPKPDRFTNFPQSFADSPSRLHWNANTPDEMVPGLGDEYQIENVEYMEEDVDEGYQLQIRSVNIGPALRGAHLRLAIAPTPELQSEQQTASAETDLSDPDPFVQRNINEEDEDLFWARE
ncbi:hypothetical protein DL98DRAFT_591062 [Cadophora sp. DSE1049]|nr:hypothetical protein DL98DRAFT_591062 [Cadophora sp. DSE1049]